MKEKIDNWNNNIRKQKMIFILRTRNKKISFTEDCRNFEEACILLQKLPVQRVLDCKKKRSSKRLHSKYNSYNGSA